MGTDWTRNYEAGKQFLQDNLKQEFFISDPINKKIILAIPNDSSGTEQYWTICDIKIEQICLNVDREQQSLSFAPNPIIEMSIKIYLQNIASKEAEEDDKYPLSIDFVLTKINDVASCWLGSNQNHNIPTRIKINFLSPLQLDNCNAGIIFSSNSFIDRPELILNKKVFIEVKDFIWIFNKKVDVFLEEYKNLRQQIIALANSLTNIFYYGVFTLGLMFTTIQGILNQFSNLNQQESITFKQFEIQFQSLSILLFFLLLLLTPLVCILFVFKWLSNAKAIGFKGYFLTKSELELNRAFNKFVVLTQNKYEHFFSDYELNLGWEINLRRLRRSVNDQSITFGNTHILLIISFFCLIALISQLMGLYLFNENNPVVIVIILCGLLLLGAYWQIYQYYIENKKWYLALNNNTKNLFLKKSHFDKVIFFIFVITLLCFLGVGCISFNNGIYNTKNKNQIIQEKIIQSLNQQEYRQTTLSLLESKLQSEKSFLSNAHLNRADFRGADFQGANLSNAHLNNADFRGAKLKDTIFDNADFTDTNFSKTDITDRQIKSACHWEKGIYKEQPEDNQKYIDELRKNENSEPSSPPQCT